MAQVISSQPQITDTGIRGFLKWFQGQQPGLYKKHVAPAIVKQLPQVFSGYEDGGWMTAGMSRTQVQDMMNRRFHGLGDDTSDASITASSDADIAAAASYTPATVDVSTAANNGTTSSGLANAIGSIISGASALYLTKQQLGIQQQVVNTQLQRAAAGLPPLPSSLANLGVPQVAVGLSAGTGTGLAIAGGALLLLLMLMGKRKRA